jgi:Cu2+-exporting ATPase
LLARFDLVENLRAGAQQVISELDRMDIGTIIASGDRPEAVDLLASRLATKGKKLRWEAAMLPQDKLQLVRELQAEGHQVTAMGDGINDSPVLAGANVSIAMGSGTSIAQHSADTVWLGQQLHGLQKAFALARKTMRIVKQNLAWALGYNLLAIPLAVTGNIDPWMAALGMSFSSLLVMLNALRLGKVGGVDNADADAEKTGGSECRTGEQGATA